MGQRWSMLKNGYLEESESEEEEDEEEEEEEEETEAQAQGHSVSLAQLRQSQATTEASSSVPVFDDRGLSSTCPNDIELSNLQSGKATVDTARRAKDASATPTVSTSHFSSVKGSLKDSEAPGCRLRPRKLALEHKLEAYREALHGQFAIRNLGAAVPSPSLMSPAPSPLTPDVAKVMELARNEIGEEEMLRSPVGGKRKLLLSTVSQPPFSPAQTLLMFQLDPKRKRSAGLPSVAFDCTGCPAAPINLKSPTLLEGPSKEAGAAEAVLDMGTGDAMVGRGVKKVVEGQRDGHKGHATACNAAQRLYQEKNYSWVAALANVCQIPSRFKINHDDGKEEVLEWLDLEPYLIARSARARPRPRYKTVDELVYKNGKRPGRQVRRR